MTESFISSMKGINPHTGDNNIVTFEVLTAVNMKITVSWDVMSCSWMFYIKVLEKTVVCLFRVK